MGYSEYFHKLLSKNKITALVFIFFFSILLLNVVQAQDEPPTELEEILPVLSDPALELSLSQYGQEYPSKSFPVTLTVKSQIDSNKVGVDWTYSSTFLAPQNGLDTDVISVSDGGTTTFVKHFDINPKALDIPNPKNLNIGVRVRGFVADENYISTKSFIVKTNAALEILPITDEYQSDKTTGIITTTIRWIVTIVIVGAGGFFGVKRFIKYLNTEEE